MSKRHFLKLFFRDERDFLLHEVRKKDSDRLYDLLSSDRTSYVDFFCYEGMEGRTHAINLQWLQAINYLWEPSAGPSDLLRYEGPTLLKLKNRRVMEFDIYEGGSRLDDFFQALEEGCESAPFPSFVDPDGELFQVSAPEVVWISAPSYLLSEED